MRLRYPGVRGLTRRVAQSVLRRAARFEVPAATRSGLRVREYAVDRPRFPAIDAHAHLRGPFGRRWAAKSAADLLRAMDAAGIASTVALDGEYGESLSREIRRLQARHPDRFAVLANMDTSTLSADVDFGAIEAERLVQSVRAGARGLKVWKTLGLSIRDADGNLIALDDERLRPIWAAAADLRVPVLIHFADPAAFFEPLTLENERWQELRRHPEWHLFPTRNDGDRRDPRPPSFEELHRQFAGLLAGSPSTTFIGAHMASSAEDLQRVSSLLDDHPNLYVDTAARLSELGRQPYSARDFLVRYQDRVLFGTDVGPDVEQCRLYYRFFETRAEYFPYSRSGALNGNWRIYAVDLPDEALRKIYLDNAVRLIGFAR
jgi:predicted TIM-barrel fold metal-dependent hydrolase